MEAWLDGMSLCDKKLFDINRHDEAKAAPVTAILIAERVLRIPAECHSLELERTPAGISQKVIGIPQCVLHDPLHLLTYVLCISSARQVTVWMRKSGV